jgi:pyruvate kinase
VTSFVLPNTEQLWDPKVIAATIDELSALRADLVALPAHLSDSLRAVHPNHAAGATNLVHYVRLRRHDVRALQDRLAWIGVSSLGRAESHVLANVDKVLGLLTRLAGRSWTSLSGEEPAGIRTGAKLLEEHACALLGRTPERRSVRIMVTLSREAGSDYGLVRSIVASGMDCARINCAHDDAPVWAAMVANIRRARDELQRPCPILFDIAGPKLRTGPIEPGPAVIKWRPQRDEFGRVLAPARIRLRPGFDSTPATGCWLKVDAGWLAGLAEGDRIGLIDAREARRSLTVREAQGADHWAECRQTAYVGPGTILQLQRGSASAPGGETPVLAVPAVENALRLHKGDILILTRDGPGRPAKLDAQGRVARPASIPCTLPEVLAQVRPGERVWFDDGRIGGVIRHVHSEKGCGEKGCGEEIHVEITVAREDGAKLAADMGINLPDSTLELAPLTAKDLEDLNFVARHADMVGLSFVRRASDIEQLQKHLTRLGAGDLGIVLKIENRTAFEHLPDLLLTGMRGRRLGVMIARGDLAVEMGWERLAEVQEEILWLVEAAHVPVIWATQVLETLAKRGLPSRAEITDAAMGERAECVMLNKGPHILEAIETLDDILKRMQGHHHKKRAMLRQLHW